MRRVEDLLGRAINLIAKEVKDFGKKKGKLIVNNDHGERIMDDVEAAEYVRTYFVSQFSDVNRSPLEAHQPSPQPL